MPIKNAIHSQQVYAPTDESIMACLLYTSLIDKTHSKMGKARPWMLYGYIGCAITLVAIFAIPTNLGPVSYTHLEFRLDIVVALFCKPLSYHLIGCLTVHIDPAKTLLVYRHKVVFRFAFRVIRHFQPCLLYTSRCV